MVTNMSLPQRRPQFKTERNRKIAEYYFNPENRMSTAALARMFQISQSRVMEILKDWREKMMPEDRNGNIGETQPGQGTKEEK